VATVGGQVVGYAVFLMRGKVAHLISIAVHPEHRRKGIGSALLSKVVESTRAGSASLLRLEVRESNLSAQELYVHAGFSASRVIHSYYDDGEDAVVMELEL